jgi:DNA (cytosine-5)-methyltransferase 1
LGISLVRDLQLPTTVDDIGSQIVEGDIRIVKGQIPPHDVLVGGFPCQPFSTLGKLQGFDDEQERGTLFFEIMEIVKRHDTKIIVLENVKNLVTHDKGETFRRIKKELEDAGYYFNAKVLNSQDFGVPQRRNRVFIVCFNKKYFKDIPFEFPESEELTVTTQDLLDKDVPEKYFLTEKISHTILGEGTKGYIVKPTIDLPISKTLTATMHKMHRASQDNYVTDEPNYQKNVVDKEKRINIRKLTPNECRKLQGFPSDWKQVVCDGAAYKQFGNAVTVNVAYKVATSVANHIQKAKL